MKKGERSGIPPPLPMKLDRMMPPPSFLPRKKQDEEMVGSNGNGYSEETESDSLVGIERQDTEMTQKKATKAPKPQPDRIAVAHELAAGAAAEAEKTGTMTAEAIEAVADRARMAAAPLIPGAATIGKRKMRKIGSATTTVPVDHIYREEDEGDRLASVRESYELLDKHVQRNIASARTGDTSAGTVAPAGQVGMKVAEATSWLVREVNRRGMHESPLPRSVKAAASPVEDTFLKHVFMYKLTDERPPHINPDLDRKLRKVIKPSTRKHEEEMLRMAESSDQGCSRGQNCMGTQLLCPGGGATLIAYIPQDEYAHYKEEMRKGASARLPNRSRRCLICIRFEVAQFIIDLRANNYAIRPEMSLIADIYNLCDVPGEYRYEDMTQPQPGIFEGIMEPIVAPQLRGYDRVKNTETGYTYFRQLLPYPGQSSRPKPVGELQNF